MDSVDHLPNLRVASFSYYLKSNDQENFIQKLMSSEQNPISSIKPTYSINFSKSINDNPENPLVKQLSAHLNDPQESFRFKVKKPSVDTKSLAAGSCPNHLERIKSNDGEIDIFGADKYFSMKLEYPAKMMPENVKNDRVVDVVPYVINSKLKQDAPSVCSEASTWSSGVALLQNFSRSKSQKKPKTITRRRFLASISCTGPCFDKESVYAKNSKEKCEIHQSGSKTNGDSFTFPLVDVVKPSLKLSLKKLEDQEIEDLRKSIEVYGSNTMKKDDIRKNLERSLSMLTWDAIPKSKSRLPTTSDVTTTACDDMASDVSSDLFEIENISATCGGYMMNRDSVEDVSSCMTPTTQYAPSEASFEWSVKTASAVDFSSAVSDYDLKNVGVSGNEFPTNSKAKDSIRSKDASKSRPGGLLGCKSLKSLNVAETVHKTKVERY